MKKNYGLDLNKEKLQQNEKDWVFGAVSPVCLAEGILERDRAMYLPKGERQDIGTEKMDCATRSPINMLEMKFNYLVQNKKISAENINFLKDNGYIENGKVRFSDRGIAILSGTSETGNSLKAPLEAIRIYGLIPKKLLPQVENWNDYYKIECITEELEELGQEFRRHFNINYEKVYEKNLDELLERDIIDMAGYAWDRPNSNGEYPRSENNPNHAFVGFKRPKTYIFDNYLDDGKKGDFIKKLAPDYDFLSYGYRVIISENKTGEIKLGFWQRLIYFIKKLLRI